MVVKIFIDIGHHIFVENGHHCILVLFGPMPSAATGDPWFNTGSDFTESSLFNVHGHPHLCCAHMLVISVAQYIILQ